MARRCRRDDRSRSPGTAVGRRRRASPGVEVSVGRRRHVARRDRHHRAGPTPGRRSTHGQRHAQVRAASTTAATSRAGGRGPAPTSSRSPSRAGAADSARARSASRPTCPTRRGRPTARAVEVGVKFRADGRRLRDRACASTRAPQHGHAHRPPVDAARHAARRRPPSRARRRRGWQEVDVRRAGARSPPARPTSRRSSGQRALRGHERRTSPRR